MLSLGLLSNTIGLLLFVTLSVLLLVNWRGQLIGSLLLLASVVSAIWFIKLLSDNLYVIEYSPSSNLFEVARSASWLLFLFVVIRQYLLTGGKQGIRLFLLSIIVIGTSGLLAFASYKDLLEQTLLFNTYSAEKITYIGYLILSLIGLLLVEKLYRSITPASRWSIKYLCLGIGGLFAYDFFLYSDSLLLNRTNTDLFDARGIINALCVPLIAVSVARNPNWKMELFVSRHVIYGTTTTLAAGLYLLVMSIAGYYIKNFGGAWGRPLQIIFFFGAVMVLLALIFSSDVRTKIKVFLAKHFYRNKYDYREEWLGFTRLLSENKNDEEFYKNIIQAISAIIKSPGGALWLSDKRGYYRLEATLNFHEKIISEIQQDDPVIEYISSNRCIIDLDQYRKKSSDYSSISIPKWLEANARLRLIVPMFNGDSLIGLAMFLDPAIKTSFNWEDMDLLKTVGIQSANYIVLFKTTEALSEARQFEAYNRLSAYVVHDLKNLVAQLSLISVNAQRYRDNKEFVDDVFATIESAVLKMKKLLNNLRRGGVENDVTPHPVRLQDIINDVIKLRHSIEPVPRFVSSDSDIFVSLDKDRFITVLEHLVQNAQEATPAEGMVELDLVHHVDSIEVQIKDTGCGMDQKFIQNRLFKPFDTTKGNAGMGIGVYESRELIEEMGGRVVVKSTLGQGTIFSIFLPVSKILNQRQISDPNKALF